MAALSQAAASERSLPAASQAASPTSVDMAAPDPRRWLGLLALSISVLTVIMTSTPVNLALPAIGGAFGVSVSNLTWVIDAYSLALGALTLPGGILGDIFGRRRMYLIGLAIFSLGALSGSAAPDLGMLIASRVAMGMGAALVLPGTLSLISAMFVGRERTTAIGLWGGMNGLGLAIGPVLGGAMVEYVDWRAVFWVNVPLVLIAFFMVPRYVPAVAPRPGKHYLDILGGLSITAGLVALIVALIEGPSWGWTDAATVGCFGLAAVLIVAFMAIEARAAQPMVPLHLFRSRTFCAANLAAAAMMLGILGCFFFLSLFLQEVLGFSALRTGMAYLPLAIFIVVLAPLAGRLSARFGPRLPMATGLLCLTAGVLWISRVDGNSGYSSLIGGLLLAGAGLGLASPPISNAAISSVPPAFAGAASGVTNMFRQVGGSVGVALLTALFAGHFKDHLTAELGHSALPVAVQQRALQAATASTGTGAAPARDALGRQIQGLVHIAFADGMGDTLTVFAALAALGVLAALLVRRSDFVAGRPVSSGILAPPVAVVPVKAAGRRASR